MRQARPIEHPDPLGDAGDAVRAGGAATAAPGTDPLVARVPWRDLLLAFAVGRVLVLLGGFGAELLARSRDMEPFRAFAHAATYPDYAAIASSGYALENATAYPLLPGAMWLGAQLGLPLALTAMLVTSGCFLAALPMSWSIGRRYVGDDAALRGTVLLALFPFSWAFGVTSSESLMLVTMLGSVLLALRATPGAWIGAGSLAALCALTRPPAAFLGLVLLAIAIAQLRDGRLRGVRIVAPLAAGLAIPAAVGVFFAYLGDRLGDPLASFHAQADFDRHLALFGAPRALVDSANKVLHGSVGHVLELGATLAAIALLLHFAATAAGRTVERRGWIAFGAASLLLPMSTSVLYEMPRLVLLIPPAFWAAGTLLARPRLRAAVYGICILSLPLFAAREVIGIT